MCDNCGGHKLSKSSRPNSAAALLEQYENPSAAGFYSSQVYSTICSTLLLWHLGVRAPVTPTPQFWKQYIASFIPASAAIVNNMRDLLFGTTRHSIPITDVMGQNQHECFDDCISAVLPTFQIHHVEITQVYLTNLMLLWG